MKRFSYHKITPSFLRCLFCVLVELPFVRQYSLHLSEDFWVLNKLVLSEEWKHLAFYQKNLKGTSQARLYVGCLTEQRCAPWRIKWITGVGVFFFSLSLLITSNTFPSTGIFFSLRWGDDVSTKLPLVWVWQLSGQTQSMGVGINSGRPRANFPRKISKENIRNNCCLVK